MGSGTILVVSKERKPLAAQEVNIEWNWIGLSTGSDKVTTNNLGQAIFNGTPAFSQGRGQVKGPLGQFANFMVETDAYGNFPPKEIQTAWNPVALGTDTLKDTVNSVTKGATQLGMLGLALGVLLLIGYTIYKKSMIGQIAGRFRSRS